MSDFSSLLVSVVLLFPKFPERLPLSELLQALEKHFEYYELLVMLNPGQKVESFEREFMAYPNTRSIVMNAPAPEDVLRKKAFEIAIGDQVIFWNFAEATPEYLPILVQSNLAGNDFSGLVFPDKDRSLYGIGARMFASFVNKLTGYSLNSRLSSVGCYSRTLVNAINARESDVGYMKLLLASAGFKHAYVDGASTVKRNFRDVARRLSGSLEIIGGVPHRLLSTAAWASLAGCLACFVFLLYAMCVWLFVPTVQRGWTTTALILSLFFAIVYAAIFIFSCIFLNRLKLESRERFSIARESSRHDFIKTFSELNVTDKQ